MCVCVRVCDVCVCLGGSKCSSRSARRAEVNDSDASRAPAEVMKSPAAVCVLCVC